ncbi:MAG: CDC48 family AAA ATPase [Nanoarchaeota archaeon]|nr:CDC48 family AAA ATPase [Nanoarchaeota archaeon]
MAEKTREKRLQVVEAQQDDAFKGIVRIDSEMLKDIDLRPGDIVEIEGARKTVAIADRAYPTDIGREVVRMDGIMRRNAKTAIGENVVIRKAEIKEAKEIIIAPAEKGMMIQGEPDVFLKGLLGRPLIKGDVVVLGGARTRRRTMSSSPFEEIFRGFGFDMGHFGFSNIRFVIVDTNPKTPIIITEDTKVQVRPQLEDKEISEEKAAGITYEDIGGLDEELKKVREMVELPLKHPELFERLGVQPPKGVLLHGPPGTGKTLLAKAVANEADAKFYSINGPEITSKFVGEAEKNIRAIFDEAEKNAPSIIFIDEIDAIASKREEAYGDVEKRIVAQLLATMDGLKSRGKVIVMAATNRPNAIDPALRRPGRFDREIEIGVPSKEGRLSVLKIHTRNMPLKYWDDPVACNLLMKRLSSFEEDAAAKINQKKTSASQLNSELKEKNKMLEESMAELRKMEQQKKETSPSFLSDLLARINFKQGKIAEMRKQTDKIKADIDSIPKEIKKVEEDIALNKEILKEVEKDKDILLELEAKLKEIIHTKEIRSFEDARSLFLNKDSKEIQGKLKAILEKFMKSGILSAEFVGEIYKESSVILLKGLAQKTYGFVGADLEALCKEAAMNVVRRVLPNVNFKEDVPIKPEILEKLVITQEDFESAMKNVGPSALREVLVDIPNIKWEDIGGLKDLKQELKEAIEWPLKYPDSFKRMGVRPPRGVMMYGPPGCGKTLLAKAAANESEANFILVKGPELLSKWVGDSEKGIREIFKKARQSSPTIIFFDEIDSIAPRRGQEIGTHVTERMVNQLLTEMDGLEELNDVIVIAATNRPDIIDPGLLRQGRFDRIILVHPPDAKAREEIFRIHTKNMPLGKDVKVEKLIEKTGNYVGSDIEGVCREAATLALRENIDAKDVRLKHFEEAMKKVKSSILNEEIQKYRDIENSYIRNARSISSKDKEKSYFG